MVGEQAQEMQLAHWIPTTQIGWLVNYVPPWVNMWFAVFPTYETMVAQLLAAVLVVGSYYAARPTRTTPASDSTELVGMQPSPSNSTSATAAASSFYQSPAATDLVAIREYERAHDVFTVSPTQTMQLASLNRGLFCAKGGAVRGPRRSCFWS
jgi:hypothetical protein